MSQDQIASLNKRYQMLKSERASWWSQWYDLSSNILPYNGRYFLSDRNKGWIRNNKIIDNTATVALRKLAAGMMSGLSSPDRPWFALAVDDEELNESKSVRTWLNESTETMEYYLSKSNAYRVLYSMYEDLGTFGTSAAFIADDFNNVIHLFPLTIGEYCIATDWKGDVTTIFREFDKTVGQLVTEFGIDKVSKSTKALFEAGSLDLWVTVRHAIEPRTDRDETKKDAINMPFSSVYWEVANNGGQVLREAGYDSFPCLVPRWATQGGDIYGNSPAMTALGDVKQLQVMQLRKSQAIDFMSNPPVQLPTSLKNRETQLFPGGQTYIDMTGSQSIIQTAFNVKLDLQGVLEDIQDCRGRINEAFYLDLFQTVTQIEESMTAYEVAQRISEKLELLGPVTDRLANEMYDPLISQLFTKLLKGGLLPEPPQELAGKSLQAKYISKIAQAQKSTSTAGTTRFVQEMLAMAQGFPGVLDNFDADEWARIESEANGVDPEMVRDEKEVDAIRQSRAQKEQAAQQSAMVNQNADSYSKLGNIPTTPGTVGGAVANKMGLH